MVTPAARRAWAVWVQEAFRVSVRRACRATGVHRSLLAYRRLLGRLDAAATLLAGGLVSYVSSS